MEQSHLKWSGACFHPSKLQVNQAANMHLVQVPKRGASLKACKQLVYSTEASHRRRSEAVPPIKAAKSRGYNKSNRGFFEPKEGSLKLNCAVYVLLPHRYHCVSL